MLREGRWAWLEALRPQALEEVIASEMAKVIASELRDWPPQIEWTDAASSTRFAAVLDTPPSAADLREGFALARLELQHDLDALRFARPSLATDLVRLYLTETLYSLAERTHNRIKRHHLRIALDRAEQLLATIRSGLVLPSGGS
jgi:hypothetical protein